MRVRFELVSVVVPIATGIVSIALSVPRYFDPFLLSRRVDQSLNAYSIVLVAIDAVIAVVLTRVALQLARLVWVEWRTDRNLARVARQVGMLLLLGPAAVVAATAAGYGDQFTLRNGQLFYWYHAAVLLAALLLWVDQTTRRYRTLPETSPAVAPVLRLSIIVVMLVVFYQWQSFSKTIGFTLEERHLSERVFQAARGRQMNLRLSDLITVDRRFVCLLHDRHEREDIEKSIGIRYRGPLIDGSDQYQIVLLDSDGRGRTVQLVGAEAQNRDGTSLCLPVDVAHISLTVETSTSGIPLITAQLTPN